MKIGIYWSQESWGGVDSHLVQLVKNWPQGSGDQITIFYNHNNKGYVRVYNQICKYPWVHFVQFDSLSYTTFMSLFEKTKLYMLFRVLFYFTMPIFYWLQLLQAYSLFKKHPVDVLISDNGGYPAAWGCLAAIQAAKWVDIPKRILLVHHCGSAASRLRGWFDKWVDRTVARGTTKLVTVSEATYQTIKQHRDPALLQVPRQVIYNGVDIPEIVSKEKSEWPIANVPRNPIWIGIVGRIEPYKGHEDLIRAMGMLTSEEKNKISLIVVGRGESQDAMALQKLIVSLGLQDHIQFTGYIDQTPQELMRFFDAVVVATRDFEGFGLTLAEAMAVGKPVIATAVGAIPEFVEDGKMGMLVQPNNPAALAKALSDLIRNQSEWQKKGLYAYEKIKRFSGVKMAQEFFNLTRERS